MEGSRTGEMKIVYQESKPKTCQNTKQNARQPSPLLPTPWAPAAHKPSAELSVHSQQFRDTHLESQCCKAQKPNLGVWKRAGEDSNHVHFRWCKDRLSTSSSVLTKTFPHWTPGSALNGHQWRKSTSPSHSNLLRMDFPGHRSRAELNLINVLRLRRACTSFLFRDLASGSVLRDHPLFYLLVRYVLSFSPCSLPSPSL